MKRLLEKIRKLLANRRTRRLWTRLVSTVAAVVVFVTTYALVLPAITMESEAYCGIEAHEHSEDCYEDQLICTIPESPGHWHDESCYTTRQELTCTFAEHTHGDECYDGEGNLICETPEHVHEGTCYEEVPELTCTLEESEGHQHDAACYEKILVCEKPVHTHSSECYQDPDEQPESAAVVTTAEGSGGTGTTAILTDSDNATWGEEPGSEDNSDDMRGDGFGDSAGTAEDTTQNAAGNSGDNARDTFADTAEGTTAGTPAYDITEILNGNDDNNNSDDISGGEAGAAGTTADPAQGKGEGLEKDRYVPALESLNFDTILTSRTAIYHYPVAEDETVEDTSQISGWKKVEKNTELGPNDLLRVYLSYTIPAGSLNETNPTAVYRLPANLRMTDTQVEAINATENGIAASYIDYSTLTVTDPDNYHKYLGAEAVEGTRTPDQDAQKYLEALAAEGKDAQEFISATVRAENVYDTEGTYGKKGAYLGQDLIFTFSPYTIEKNQNTYDASGQPTSAGQKVRGWFSLDFNLSQVDLGEPFTEENVESTETIENADINQDAENLQEAENLQDTENAGENGGAEDPENAENSGSPDAGKDGTATTRETRRIREFQTADVIFVEKDKDLGLEEISTKLLVLLSDETVVTDKDSESEGTDDADGSDDAGEAGRETLFFDEDGNPVLEEAGQADEGDTTEAADQSGENDKADDAGKDGEDKDKTEKDDQTADKDTDKTDSEPLMPAMSFEDSIRVSTGKPAGVEDGSAGTAAANAAEALPKKAKVTVRVEADEGTFPVGTTMVLSAVEDMDAVAETVRDAVENAHSASEKDSPVSENSGSADKNVKIAADNNGSVAEDNQSAVDTNGSAPDDNQPAAINSNQKTYGFQAVDISFRDKDGNEIEPAKPVRVALTSSIVERVKKEKEEDANSVIADPVVVHVDDDGNTETMELVAPDEIEPAKGKTEEELLKEQEEKEKETEEKEEAENKEAAESEKEAEEETEENRIRVEKETEEKDAAEEPDTEENIATAENNPKETETSEEKNTANEPDREETVNGETTESAAESATVFFDADSFSVYAIVYTVDFHYEVNGKMYDFSIPGGGFVSFHNLVEVLGIVDETYNGNSDAENSENRDAVSKFLSDVESVTFSNPELVSVSKVEENTTVGAIKDDLGLECEYSAELTEEAIVAIDAQNVVAGDWALISLKAFATEESLTVSMVNGDQFVVKVTDAQIVTDSATFKTSERFVIAYVNNEGKYIVLTSTGSWETFDTAEDIDFLDSKYLWRFYYVFTEKDQNAPNANYEYYFIRPIEDLSKSIALIDVNDTDLIQTGANNIAVIPQGDDTFIMEGYSSVGAPMPYLYFNGTDFLPDMTNNTSLTIFTQDDIKKYQFTVRTADPDMGLVYGKDKEGVQQNGVEQFVTRTKDSHNNNWGAQAKANDESAGGQYRYLFDYFDLNGVVVPANKVTITNEGRNAKIGADNLEIPYNGSILTAHFKQNPNYVGASKVDSLQDWVNEIKNTNVPLDEEATKKTAEVYDYENRIYRVDLTTRSSLSSFTGTVDLGLILDVSGSMKFPSKLVAAKDTDGVEIGTKNIRSINEATGWDWWGNPIRYAWQDWKLDTSKYYYVIAESSTRATVFRLFYDDDGWHRVDASKDSDYDSSQKLIDASTDFGVDTDFNYLICASGDNKTDGTPVTRSYYEKQSIDNTADTLNQVLGILNIAANSSESPDVRAAWNTFAFEVKDYEHSFVDLKSHNSLSINYATAGGTRTDLALTDGLSFAWGDSNTKYAILITDGAPQFGSANNDHDSYNTTSHTLDEKTNELISRIMRIKQTYESQGIKLITVGLSMKDVPKGTQLLYDIADTVDGKHMFFQAESGDELENVLLEIVKTLLLPCNVYGDVTDKVSDAFYLVDRESGKPLQPGDHISLSGDLTDNLTQPYGTVQSDGKTVKWENQEFDPEGWQGTLYVKAKEDLLGGNMLPTNTGNAVIEAKEYSTRTNPDHRIAITTNTEQIVNPERFNRLLNRETPLVNVNELSFLQNDTEWTVYLGTEVDPGKQLEELWHNILVEEVLKNNTALDLDGDGLPETGKNQSGNYWYPLAENSIVDDRESAGSGDRQTFTMNDLIKVLAGGKNYTWWDDNKGEPKWNEFLQQALGEGITIPYNVYGIQDNSNIVISLTKTIDEGEEVDLINNSPHVTAVTGDGVEQYTLTVKYSPDYTVLPRGQGGSRTEDIHTGTFGTLYQGHGAGTETSSNNHVINVYAEPLDVLKIDDHSAIVPGAVFKLYRTAKTGETGESLASYDTSLTGSYYCISTATSDSNGIAHLAPDDVSTPTHTIPVAAGQTSQNLLMPGETYYLVEASAPSGYKKDDTVRTVTVEVGPDLFTKLDKTTSVESASISGTPARPVIAYNWNEGVTITVKELGSQANENQADLVNHTTRETVTLKDANNDNRTYMLRSDSDNLVVTQVTILNTVIVDIRIQKIDIDGNGLAGAVFRMQKVGNDGHSESDVEGITGIATVTKEIDGETKAFTSAFETTGDEQTFNGLPDGTYRLYEAYVPAGYISAFRYIEFTIENRVMKNVKTDTNDSTRLDFTAATGNNLALLKIKNTPGAALPSTGGPGTNLIYLIGSILLAFAATGLLMQKKRRATA